MRATLSRFAHSTEAVSAIEFAVVFPVLLAVMAGAFELSREVNSARRLTTFASSAATMIASNASGSIAYTDLHYAFDSAMITFPDVLSDSFAKKIPWSNDITISMTGVVFAPTVSGCTAQCTYKANVMWTGAAAKRTCGSILTAADDASSPTPTTLPTDLYTPVSNASGTKNPPSFAVVVDVIYTWTPTIFSNVFGSVTLKRSAYVAPRYSSKITYKKVSGDDGFGAECAGY